MAFLSSIASFFMIPMILSLMGKKRAAAEEAGPSRERRGKKKANQTVKASSELRSKKRHETPLDEALVEDLGNFSVRKVAFEASVEEHLLGKFSTLNRLMKKDWDPMFFGGGRADVGQARTFYTRIRNPQYEPLGFDLIVRGQEHHLGVEEIAELLGVSLGEVQIDETNLESKEARDERTRFLCGRLVPWNREVGLYATYLTTEYRVLHRVATHNIYPRLKNRTECSRYMVEFLYQVGRGADVCAPSTVLYQIVRAASAVRKDAALPFGRLACFIARQYGIGGSDGELVPTQLLGDDMLNHMKIGPKQRQARIDQYGDAAEEEEGSGGSNEDEDEDEAEEEERTDGIEEVRESSTAPDIGERLDVLQAEVAEIKGNQARILENQAKQEKWNKKMYRAIKALICCSKGEEAPPLSPDSDE